MKSIIYFYILYYFGKYFILAIDMFTMCDLNIAYIYIILLIKLKLYAKVIYN